MHGKNFLRKFLPCKINITALGNKKSKDFLYFLGFHPNLKESLQKLTILNKIHGNFFDLLKDPVHWEFDKIGVEYMII